MEPLWHFIHDYEKMKSRVDKLEDQVSKLRREIKKMGEDRLSELNKYVKKN